MPTADRRLFLGTLLGAAAAAPLSAATRRPRQDPSAKPLAGCRTRFACNLEIWWSGLPFLERLERAADAGFPAVEFWPWRGKDLDALAKRARELGMEVAQFTAWGFEPGMNNPKHHAAVVREIEESCQVAQRLSCKKMTVVGGNDQPGMSQAEMHEHIVAALKLAAPIAERHDVMLILEPMNIRVDHKGHCLYGSEAAVKICRAVGSTHVKINWDLYHMQLSEGDLCGRLRDGFDQLGYAQVADTPGRNEPGTGEIQYRRVLRELYHLGYRGAVGCECWPADDEETAIQRLVEADSW